MMIKYPVHKLAKDFSRRGKTLPSKEIMDILARHRSEEHTSELQSQR